MASGQLDFFAPGSGKQLLGPLNNRRLSWFMSLSNGRKLALAMLAR